MSKKYYACIYGGGSQKLDNAYIEEVEKLGKRIADHGFSLIFGGGASGCMGAAARGVHDNDGYVLGISPYFMDQFEPIFDCDNLVLVDTMAERKMLMEKHADLFFITPGGIGTMDEFFEILTLKYLKKISAPIVILNCNGFYNSLLALIDHLIAAKAAIPEVRSYFDVIDSVDDPVLSQYFEEIKLRK